MYCCVDQRADRSGPPSSPRTPLRILRDVTVRQSAHRRHYTQGVCQQDNVHDLAYAVRANLRKIGDRKDATDILDVWLVRILSAPEHFFQLLFTVGIMRRRKTFTYKITFLDEESVPSAVDVKSTNRNI